MASFSQNKYCYNCKKNVTTTKQDPTHCPACKSVVALKDWTVRFRVIENAHRKNKRLSGFATKKEAQQGLAQYLINLPNATNPTQSFMFQDLLKEYLDLDKTQTAPATYYDKKAIFLKYILTDFKNKDLSKLQKIDYLTWQDKLWTLKSASGKLLSFKYKSKIRGHFSAFLTYCEARYNIVNYFNQIKLPKNIDAKKEMQIIDLNDFDLFIQQIENDQFLTSQQILEYKTLFMCLFYLGCRINELLALQITDVNLKENKINFNKSISRKFAREEFINKFYIVKQTKNSKIRQNIIPDILHKQIKLYLKTKNDTDKYLFGNTEPLHEKFVTRLKNKYLELANLPYMRLHDFRHSHVSFLIHLGVSFPVIAQRIGDTLDVVIKTYSHIYKNDEQSAISNLNLYLKK